ncbi:MAG: hypothetical protein II715_00050 [Clostridia bacterium]|nr:hypothetical protein [Clostridia bacterium]
MEWMIGLIGGAFGAGLLSLVQFFIARHDKKKEAESVERKALRYLMLYTIQDTARELISAGQATMDERRQLREWHDLYHKGLGGNGDADKLMEAVDRLPFSMN